MNPRDDPDGTDGTESGPDDQRYSANFRETGDESPSICVVTAVAAATNRDPVDLRPLYRAIDPDALDRLLQSGPDVTARASTCRLEFRFEGCDVAVYANGETVIDPVDE